MRKTRSLRFGYRCRMHRIQVIDSHTGGEPTRVVIDGGPALGDGPLAERRERFRKEHDRFRSAVVNEPRGSDVMVGALLCEPVDPRCAAGVIFFNNVGTLGMCGHGTIGLVVTLAHLGRITPGTHLIETPVGVVSAELHDDHRVSVTNVPSYRFAANVAVDVPGHGVVHGDVAWGGNWFFLVRERLLPISTANLEALTELTSRIMQSLDAAGVRGAEGAVIDHVELFEPSPVAGLDSRNYVLCPGKAYDRSPCGTGTSAKLACLAADGKLQPGAVWKQESVIGSVFEGSYTPEARDGWVVPRITGTAWINAEATLLLDERDPFCWGIRPA
jgi:4-hydroxyproline epimerase